jgi:hypothetical protein
MSGCHSDAIVLITAHPGTDHSTIAQQASLFVALRGATRDVDAPSLVTLECGH